MIDLQHLLIEHGLAAVAIGSAIEGDFTMILAGVVSHLGYFRFPVAVGIAALGAFIGDCCWYFLGRAQTTRFRGGQFYRKVGPRIEQIARKVGVWQLVAARFVYGTKNASMFFWGLHGLRFARFALVDAIGCTAGAAVFVGLGYLIGNGADAIMPLVKRFELVLLGALVLAVAGVLGVRRRNQRRREREKPLP